MPAVGSTKSTIDYRSMLKKILDMVKKTKRFKYEAKKSAKEYIVREEPKPKPALDNPILDKKRIIMIAAGAAGILDNYLNQMSCI